MAVHVILQTLPQHQTLKLKVISTVYMDAVQSLAFFGMRRDCDTHALVPLQVCSLSNPIWKARVSCEILSVKKFSHFSQCGRLSERVTH